MTIAANQPIYNRNPKAEPAKPTVSSSTANSGPIPGRLEVAVKINELPRNVRTRPDGWPQFQIDCGGRIVAICLRPKAWRKIEEAQANWPQWIAVISGKIGAETKDGFELIEPAVQVFEKKPAAAAPANPPSDR